MFTPSFTPRGEHYCVEEWRGKQRISPQGDNFTLGSKFAPRGEVKNEPQVFYSASRGENPLYAPPFF
jgi:hypothetical protein